MPAYGESPLGLCGPKLCRAMRLGALRQLTRFAFAHEFSHVFFHVGPEVLRRYLLVSGRDTAPESS